MIIYEDNHLTIFQSSLYKTNSTVLITDDFALIVDPTWLPEEVAEIKVYVENKAKDKPLYLLFTHSDFDHILGYGAFPNAITIGNHILNKRTDKARIINQIKEFDDQYYLDRDYDIAYPDVKIEVEYDNQQIKIGEYNLHFHLAPGHTNDGIITLINPLGILIVGDYLSDLEFPFIFDSSSHYLSTLSKLQNIIVENKINLLIPGHGKFTSNYQEMNQRILNSYNYIEQTLSLIFQNNVELSYDIISNYNYQSSLKNKHKDNIELLVKENKVTFS
ncbi:hydrolase glyoxylase [Bacillus sp. MKU004]|nr:hydrolase glyoxylase [Bacillus sp. MKU004]